jgi:hypothetical protein
MTDATIAERMARYERAQSRRGFVRVTVWVPEAGRDALRDYAKGLRKVGPKAKGRRAS